MGVAELLEKMPGAFELMPQQIAKLSPEACAERLAALGVSAKDLGDAEVRAKLEEVLSRRYCGRFLPAMALGLLAWGCAAAVLPSEGAALCMLALPGPILLLWGNAVKAKRQGSCGRGEAR
mmetsp:Transcript_31716/g.98918  ORF Transcript_31716/g.98918 Transcript_31716/m.98918 type:complete len:121 (+) Transcript_31716:85-447(+)